MPRVEEILGAVRHPRVGAALALSEETGEVCDLVLKRECYGKDLAPDALAGELVDVLVCVAELANAYEIDLERAAEAKRRAVDAKRREASKKKKKEPRKDSKKESKKKKSKKEIYSIICTDSAGDRVETAVDCIRWIGRRLPWRCPHSRVPCKPESGSR